MPDVCRPSPAVLRSFEAVCSMLQLVQIIARICLQPFQQNHVFWLLCVGLKRTQSSETSLQTKTSEIEPQD